MQSLDGNINLMDRRLTSHSAAHLAWSPPTTLLRYETPAPACAIIIETWQATRAESIPLRTSTTDIARYSSAKRSDMEAKG